MDPITGLALGRIAVGVAALVKPDLVATSLGSPPSGLVTRWFGNREIALGVATLIAGDHGRSNLVLIGVGVDTADAATAYLGTRSGSLSKSSGMTMVAIASGAAAAGLVGLRAPRG